jgi:hypothetical protein
MTEFETRVNRILKKHNLIGGTRPSAYSSIYLGIVDTEIDPNQSGEIQVTLPHIGQSVPVTYSTPYHGKGGSGFWAVPEKDTTVIVAHIADGNPSINPKRKYIYLGSIPYPDLGIQTVGDEVEGIQQKGGVLPDKDIYKARARPMKYVWKSPKGHSFTMSDLYDPTFFNTRIEMRSGGGKVVTCDDSPEKDCILIQNEHGDYIKLATSNVPPTQRSRSLDVWTWGPQSYRTCTSQMDLRVDDGLNLDIVNTATGKFAPATKQGPGIGESPAPFGPIDVGSWGKVNILAQNNDVTITANEGKGTVMEEMPSIFITTNGSDSLVQIDSRGQMKVLINKNIYMVSEKGDIDIEALEGNINITAEKGDINLSTPEGVINLN